MFSRLLNPDWSKMASARDLYSIGVLWTLFSALLSFVNGALIPFLGIGLGFVVLGLAEQTRVREKATSFNLFHWIAISTFFLVPLLALAL